MTASAGQSRTAGWKLWVLGVAAPIACFAVDYIAGEFILKYAPAALLTLAVIGIASLALSRRWPQGAVSLAAVGPMWVAGALATLLAIPLAALSGLGLLSSLTVLSRSPQAGALLVIWSLLGFTPLWTGTTYLREASALTRSQAVIRGKLKTRLFGATSAIAAMAVIGGAQAIDNYVINAQLEELESTSAEAWQKALQSLKDYPLCGRVRCQRILCAQPTWQYLEVPASLDEAFKKAFGRSTSEACSVEELAWPFGRS